MMPKAQLALSFLASAALIATTAAAQLAAEGGRTFVVALTGGAEVPGPGDPDGAGTATITVNPSQQRVCYELEVTNIAPATAAHIHIGAADVAGPVFQGLLPPTDGDSEACITSGRLAAQLWARPSNFYVNVHNADFPGGAIRGQLPAKKS